MALVDRLGFVSKRVKRLIDSSRISVVLSSKVRNMKGSVDTVSSRVLHLDLNQKKLKS